MAYAQLLSAANPGCVLLLIDQSYSMHENVAGTSESKADVCAAAVNRTLFDIVLACRSGLALKDRVYVGSIGYGKTVAPAFSGALAGKQIVPLSQLAHNPVTGGPGQMPTWVGAASDNGTPMHKALNMATEWLTQWCQLHPDSFPPVIINVTDGEPDDDKEVRNATRALSFLSTSDGAALLMNIHVSAKAAPSVVLPSTKQGLHDQFAELLFDISTPLPAPMIAAAQHAGFGAAPGARGFIYNATPDHLTRLLSFGTSHTRRTEKARE